MKHMAAALLVHLSGVVPTAENVTAVITSAGGSIDEASLASLIADLAGADFEALLTAGNEKLSNVSVGGGGGPAAGGAAPATAAKVEVVVEEEEVDMGGSMDMFGGDAGGGDY